MDFLDPQKQKAHTYRILIGYVVIGLTIITATTILLYQAYGFGYKNGQVIQNGLVFMSSTPSGADVYYNGKKHSDGTNTRLVIPAGQYTFELKRDGYRTWKRAINVEGGVVVRFDYPFLLPDKLTPTTLKRYEAQPTLTLQSPDRRWLMIQNGAPSTPFEVYDLANPTQDPKALTIPVGTLTKGDGADSLELIKWAKDNRHVLLRHLFAKSGQQQHEYLLVDREDPARSINLSATLAVNPQTIELVDGKHDQYYLYDQPTLTLTTATLKEPIPRVVLQQVLAFKSQGSSIVYATADAALPGKIRLALRQNDKEYTVRQVTAGSTYFLDIAKYDGAWYILAGAQSEDRTYVYKDPVGALSSKPTQPLVPVQVLKVAGANHVGFSDNSRFLFAQNDRKLGVYDAETDRGYTYELDVPLDPPQSHASWMDGHHLQIISGGKLVIFDFDNANQQTVVDAIPAFVPFYDQRYQHVYTISPQKVKAADGTEKTQFALTSTALRTNQDL